MMRGMGYGHVGDVCQGVGGVDKKAVGPKGTGIESLSGKIQIRISNICRLFRLQIDTFFFICNYLTLIIYIIL